MGQLLLHKPELLELSSDTRAFALVGGFMGFFALLEAGISQAIGVALALDDLGTVIVTRNIGFEEKIRTLRTGVDTRVNNLDQKRHFEKLLIQARKLGEDRNIVAHTPFRGSPTSDGVEFFVVKATSQLRFPKIDWSIDDFLGRIGAINELDNEVRAASALLTIELSGEAATGGPRSLTKAGLLRMLMSATGGAPY